MTVMFTGMDKFSHETLVLLFEGHLKNVLSCDTMWLLIGFGLVW